MLANVFMPRSVAEGAMALLLVVGAVDIKPQLLEQAVELGLAHVQRSRAEPGCISHGIYRDVETPDRLVFVERWQDEDALTQHFALPTSRQFVGELTGLAATKPSLAIYSSDSGRDLAQFIGPR